MKAIPYIVHVEGQAPLLRVLTGSGRRVRSYDFTLSAIDVARLVSEGGQVLHTLMQRGELNAAPWQARKQKAKGRNDGTR